MKQNKLILIIYNWLCMLNNHFYHMQHILQHILYKQMLNQDNNQFDIGLHIICLKNMELQMDMQHMIYYLYKLHMKINMLNIIIQQMNKTQQGMLYNIYLIIVINYLDILYIQYLMYILNMQHHKHNKQNCLDNNYQGMHLYIYQLINIYLLGMMYILFLIYNLNIHQYILLN